MPQCAVVYVDHSVPLVGTSMRFKSFIQFGTAVLCVYLRCAVVSTYAVMDVVCVYAVLCVYAVTGVLCV